MLLTGCSAKEQVSFSLFVLTVLSVPFVGAQAIIGTQAISGKPVASPVWRAFAVIVFVSSMVGSVLFVWGGIGELERLSHESRVSLASEYVILLLPNLIVVSLFGRVLDTVKPRFDVEGDPLPPRRALTIAWAVTTLAVAVAASLHVFL